MPPKIAMTATPVMSGMGWSKGMAFQVSLPNTLFLRAHDDWAFAGWQLLGQNGGEQPRPYCPIGVGCYVLGLAQQRSIGAIVERCALGLGGTRPGVELGRGDGTHLESHVGEPVAAEMSGNAVIHAGLIRLQVELGPHAVHGIDLTAQLR